MGKAVATKTEQESVLNESLLALFGFNTKAVCDWEAIWGHMSGVSEFCLVPDIIICGVLLLSPFK